MKKTNILILLILISITFCFSSCKEDEKGLNRNHVTTELPSTDIVKHGEYLVTVIGCNDCHSPKEMGPKGPEIIADLILSGFPSDRPIVEFTDPLLRKGFAMLYPDLTAAAGPWGISFAANLTPDETGIGTWTEDQFRKAMQQGKYKGLEGSRMLLPPMPWYNYSFLKDEDIHAIFMYLNSIKPIENVVPSAMLANSISH